ncbi:MAG TPA: L-threonylcarbamoyladenylate synthase [Arenimonas sp.]|nr:L-threonylcarbamoyladenylate synthase [Arenimonas sp.]
MPPALPANEIEAAVAALRRGEAIGLPTETVYGLAADARNADAVRRIFALKGRPADHPLIVHIAGIEQLSRWASEVPESARRLAERFWPGPLTLILTKRAEVPDVVTGGQDSIGLRCPNHPVALALLRAFEGGLAAPSANRFGRISPTLAEHVREEFGAAVPVVLDGGPCAVGLESTIVDFSGPTPRILRPGQISRGEIEALIGAVESGSSEHSPRASGTLEAHYAPRTRMRLLPRRELIAVLADAHALGQRCALLAIERMPERGEGLVLPPRATRYGHDLYAALRRLDALGADLILVEQPPSGDDWLAVNDRLRRAAAGAGADADEDGT